MQNITPTAGKRVRERFLVLWGGNTVSGLKCAIGPATTFRSVGSILRLGPRWQEAARFRDGQWHSRKTGGRFQYLWTETPSLLRLENPATGQSMTVGTYDMIGVLRNTIYAERENSRPVVMLDERTGLWHTVDDDRRWPELTVQPVTQPAWPVDILAQLPAPGFPWPEAAVH
ncbi:MAG TPA: hypothetical protein VGN12_04060 [Pirellulales bacterium]